MKVSITFIWLFITGVLFAAGTDTLNCVDSLGFQQGYWKITAAMKNQQAQYPSPDFIIEEGKYVDSRKTGTWFQFWPNGNLKSKMEYVKNRPNGPATLYFENGHVNETGTWRGMRWIGEYRLYYPNDTIQFKLHFDSLGDRDGIQYYYYPNGKFQTLSTYSHGKQDGWTKEYYDDGSLKMERYYTNSVLDPSKTKEYAPPPGVKVTMPEEGKREGIQYHPVDPEHKEIYFNAPDPNRKDYIYDEQGKLIQIKVYKDGKYVGDEPLPEGENR